jgi:hypothetical protein
MHHFPFHISDFALATQRFTPEQIGVFLALLMEYYKTEKPLPADVEELCFMSGAMTAASKKAVEFVLKRCFVLNSEGTHYHQRRADRELENYRKACRQNLFAIICKHWEKVNKGYPKPTFEEFTKNPARYYDADTRRLRALTGRKDLVLESEADGNTAEIPEGSQPRTSNQDPVSNNQCTPVVPTGTPTIEALAEAIYALYPRKVGKTAALKAIEKVLKAGTITELELQERVRAYSTATAKWSQQDKTYIPNPSTWFNQGRYMDDPATWIRDPASARKKEEGVLFGSEKKEGADGPEWDWQRFAIDGLGMSGVLPWPDLLDRVRAYILSEYEILPPPEKKKWGAGAPRFECPTPCDWRVVWAEIYGELPCPETWDGVLDVGRRQILARIEEKKRKGGAGQ